MHEGWSEEVVEAVLPEGAAEREERFPVDAVGTWGKMAVGERGEERGERNAIFILEVGSRMCGVSGPSCEHQTVNTSVLLYVSVSLRL